MTTDLTMLVLACLLGIVQVFLYSVFVIPQVGVGYAAGPRDQGLAAAGIAGRLKRAYLNHFETLPLFAVAVLVAHVSGKANDVTAAAAVVYLLARLAYLPAYAFGIPYVRTMIWAVATSAIVAILFTALI